MKHVAIVIPTIDRVGGAERQALLLARGLARRGWRVTLVALAGNGGGAKVELERDGIGYVSLEMRKGLADPRGWLRFRRWMRAERPEVVHAHLPVAAWLARWSRLAAPVRIEIDTLHSTSTGGWGRRWGYVCSRWLADRVTAVSEAVAQTHCAKNMVLPEAVTVVPNGVDIERWSPDAAVRKAAREALGLAGEFLWLAAGRLETVKDYPTLLRAFAKTRAGFLAIAGSGPAEFDLKQLTCDLGLSARVRFLGFEPEMARWMRAADAFVLSSLWEGLPMSLLEAGACGLPAVATDVPGTSELLQDQETGLLVAAKKPDALAESMMEMMNWTPQKRAAMGARARQQVAQRFSLQRVLDRWEALYGALLEKNPKPARWAHRHK